MMALSRWEPALLFLALCLLTKDMPANTVFWNRELQSPADSSLQIGACAAVPSLVVRPRQPLPGRFGILCLQQQHRFWQQVQFVQSHHALHDILPA